MVGHSLSKVAALSLLWQGFAKDLETCTQNCETEEVGLLQDLMMRARNKMKVLKPEDYRSTSSCWSVTKDTSFNQGVLVCENLDFFSPAVECAADGGMKLCLEECKVLCENTQSCRGIAYLTDTETCYMHGDVTSDEDCQNTEAWKYTCEPSCWQKEVGKTYSTDTMIPCTASDNDDGSCAADGGYANATRHTCRRLCETTSTCVSFTFMNGGPNGNVCYLSNDATKTEPCEGTEIWYPDCPTTTTTTTTTYTQHDCWDRIQDTTFSKSNALSCADMDMKQDVSIFQCDADGGVSGSGTTRELCKKLCGEKFGCAGFSYVDGSDTGDMDKCYFTRVTSDSTSLKGTDVYISKCPATTTTTTTTTTYTQHDCWDRIQDTTFSKSDALSCADMDMKQDASIFQCDADGGVSGSGTTRELCKKFCGEEFGCAGFSYVDGSDTGDMDKCYFTTVTTDSSSLKGTETWYSKCPATTTTTTTKCAICTETCDNAHILDLRYIAWSNLGCKGPNKTITIKNQEHKFPCEIRYWNVLNATEPDKAVYLVVTVADTRDPNAEAGEGYPVYKPGNVMMNGVTSEPKEEAEAENRAPIGGAYGQINMQAGTNATFRFQFLDVNSNPIVVPKVVAQTFLDIDQPVRSRFNAKRDGGGETLLACAGNRSFGYAHNYNLYWNWTQGSVPTEACFKVESSAKGGPKDNPWNPGRKNQDGVAVGLTSDQASKAWTIANYKQKSWTATFAVKPSSEDVMAGATERNLNFAFHKTSFCELDKANEVIDDDCKMRKQRNEQFDDTLCQNVAAAVEAASK